MTNQSLLQTWNDLYAEDIARMKNRGKRFIYGLLHWMAFGILGYINWKVYSYLILFLEQANGFLTIICMPLAWICMSCCVIYCMRIYESVINARHIQALPKTAEELRALGCNSWQTVALFYATKLMISKHKCVSRKCRQWMRTQIDVLCPEFSFLYSANAMLWDEIKTGGVSRRFLKWMEDSWDDEAQMPNEGPCEKFYLAIKPTTTEAFQQYMDDWLKTYNSKGKE